MSLLCQLPHPTETSKIGMTARCWLSTFEGGTFSHPGTSPVPQQLAGLRDMCPETPEAAVHTVGSAIHSRVGQWDSCVPGQSQTLSCRRSPSIPERQVTSLGML